MGVLLVTDDILILDTGDRIAYDRCNAKLRLIDREIERISHVEILTYKHEPNILYEVHDQHQQAAIYHILAAIQDAEGLARQIKSYSLRMELLRDVMDRRLAWYDLFDIEHNGD
jgi:hypothetical protein